MFVYTYSHIYWNILEVASWSKQADLDVILNYATLFQDFLSIAPNGLVSSKKLRLAVERLDSEKKVNHTKNDTQDFADRVDCIIRMTLKQLRDLKHSAAMRERLFGKVNHEGLNECTLRGELMFSMCCIYTFEGIYVMFQLCCSAL